MKWDSAHCVLHASSCIVFSATCDNYCLRRSACVSSTLIPPASHFCQKYRSTLMPAIALRGAAPWRSSLQRSERISAKFWTRLSQSWPTVPQMSLRTSGRLAQRTRRMIHAIDERRCVKCHLTLATTSRDRSEAHDPRD